MSLILVVNFKHIVMIYILGFIQVLISSENHRPKNDNSKLVQAMAWCFEFMV